jgi:uncharacterized protein
MGVVIAASVVCISRADFAGGEEVGRLVAEKLGFRYVDEEIIVAVAEKEEMWPEALALVEDRKAGRRLEVYDAGSEPTKVLRSLIRDAIRETAKQGPVVIVAHASSFALGGGDGILRVLVTASSETRARRFAEVEGVETGKAASAIKESDKGRAVYLKRFYDVNRELPTHYDLLLNTDFLTVRQVADIIVRAATS